MWKKIVQNNVDAAIKAGDIISQHITETSLEYTVEFIRKEYISARHTSSEGGTEERYFPYANLYSNNWWLKRAS